MTQLNALIPFGALGLGQRAPFERLFDRLFDGLPGFATDAGGGFELRLDVREFEDRFVIRAEVPGLAPDDVHVELHDDVLTLSGEKRSEAESAEGEVRYSERRFGAFRRSLRLPFPVDADKVEAVHANGVLEVSLRKAEEARPRRIQVQRG